MIERAWHCDSWRYIWNAHKKKKTEIVRIFQAHFDKELPCLYFSPCVQVGAHSIHLTEWQKYSLSFTYQIKWSPNLRVQFQKCVPQAPDRNAQAHSNLPCGWHGHEFSKGWKSKKWVENGKLEQKARSSKAMIQDIWTYLEWNTYFYKVNLLSYYHIAEVISSGTSVFHSEAGDGRIQGHFLKCQHGQSEHGSALGMGVHAERGILTLSLQAAQGTS